MLKTASLPHRWSSFRSSGRASSPPWWTTTPAAFYTYSQAGAKYGYLPLWTLLPITVLLIVTQEMCSRMGAVTGKGLSDLIREEFGLRTTFLMMAALVLANLTNVMANFAGIASSLELFHVSRYISVPIGGLRRLAVGRQGHLSQRGEGVSVRLRDLRLLHHLGRSGEAGLEGGGHLQRASGADAAIRVTSPCSSAWWAPPSRPGCSSTCRRRWWKRASRPRSTPRVAHRGDRRLHRHVGDRVLHHRGLRRRHLDESRRATSTTPPTPRSA